MSGTLGVRAPNLPNLDPVSSATSVLVAEAGVTGLSSIDAVATYLGGQNPQLAQLTADVAALKADMASVKPAVSVLSPDVAALKTDMAGQKSLRGWQRLSTFTVSGAANNVIVALPDGYSRYRVEFEGVNGSGAVGQLQMRSSADGATFVASPGQYGGVVTDADGATVQSFNMATATAALLTGNHQNTAEGIVGFIEYSAIRTTCLLSAVYVNPTGPTRYFRSGAVAHPIARWAMFMMSNGSVSLAGGSRFDVLVRP